MRQLERIFLQRRPLYECEIRDSTTQRHELTPLEVQVVSGYLDAQETAMQTS